MASSRWYTLSPKQVFSKLDTTPEGLPGTIADQRLEQYGPNQLPEPMADTWGVIFVRQFHSPLIYILLCASLAVFWLGDVNDSLIIGFVLLFNAVIGAIQEGRAQQTLLALRRLGVAEATVLRDGQSQVIAAKLLVPGDVILLQAGDRIPADARIISANTFKVDQSALTGESLPITKHPRPLAGKLYLPADQSNMVFGGTFVVNGHARAVVVATGLQTMMGEIAQDIALIKTELSLARSIRRLSQLILWLVLLVVVVTIGMGVAAGLDWLVMFKVAIALAVAAVPEGLPVVLTVVLATGVWRMSKRHALVKRLQAVETLGRAAVIAVDKTGTITRNEMMIRRVYTHGQIYDIEGSGYETTGRVYQNNKVINPARTRALWYITQIAALCANARPLPTDGDSLQKTTGDPTEAAMFVLGLKLGVDKDELEQEMPQTFELPFSSHTKYHATIHRHGKSNWLKVVGAPESVLALSTKVWHRGKLLPLTKARLAELEQVYTKLSSSGLRILAVADHPKASSRVSHASMPPLRFVGFLAMHDGLRDGVVSSVKRARAAGLRIVMITGDLPITARAIAKDAGIYRAQDQVMIGEEIEAMTDAQLASKIPRVTVFARVTPEHKMRIVQAYQANNQIVAMTGDGVNDAPSLVAADLGIGMGLVGTEVAKEASDIVLTDDNLSSIIAAIEEGRNIYKTIQKVLLYLFSTSLGEVVVILLALGLGYPLPILATQILWLNLVTDGFMVVALAMEPKESDLLRHPPSRPTPYIVTQAMLGRVALMAGVMAFGSFAVFALRHNQLITSSQLVDGLPLLWTLTLTVLAAFQWFNAWNCRSDRESIFTRQIVSNPYLVLGLLASVGAHLLAVYHPLMQKILHTTALGWAEWGLVVSVSASVVVAEEVRKLIVRWRSESRSA